MTGADAAAFLLEFLKWLGQYLATAVGDPAKAAVLGLVLIAAGYMGRALTALGIGVIAVSVLLYLLHAVAP